MFQTFKASTSPQTGGPRLERLRVALTDAGYDGFLIPRADVHQGEYVTPHDQRLAWLTGFTGSAGFCAVLPNIAGVFVDGRYTIQILDQIDTDHFTPVNHPDVKLGDWLQQNLKKGRVAYDPWLHTTGEIEAIKARLQNVTLHPTQNFIDAIWDDQPSAPCQPMTPYPVELAGEASVEKRTRLAENLREAKQKCAILTQPDAIAWLLNTRGSDIKQTPVTHAFAILHDTADVTLFISPQKVTKPLQNHLGQAVTIRDVADFEHALASLDGPVRVDYGTAPDAVTTLITKPVNAADPTTLPKACKNTVEIAGSRAAHQRDGVAMVEFLTWLDASDPTKLTEIDIVIKLEAFRVDTGALKDISFDTISGAGPNGAIVHYKVTEQTNRQLRNNELLLVDSGGQYEDGTTDITRTIAIGEPSEEAIHAFTLVLKGMINLSKTKFPKGCTGRDIDPIARAPLWSEGLDYDHGTGHGVGAYLSVHEGPARISRASTVPLQTGMILSNEPGYYKAGAYGIRIENLIVVEPGNSPEGRDMLQFETLTYVPIDRRLINADLLSSNEVQWLNAYHAQCAKRLFSDCSPNAQDWLKTATKPL